MLTQTAAARRLKAGECLVAFNRSRSIATFVDSAGGLHRYYCPQGRRYDLATLAEQVAAGLSIELHAGKLTKSRKAPKLKRAA